MGIDTTELFSEQPLIDEGTDGGGEFEDSQVLDSTTDNVGTTDTPPEPSGESSVEPPAPKRDQKVPLSALHEERTKRQQYEADLKAERDGNRELQRQLAQYMVQQQQIQQPPAPPPEAPPAFEEDPVAAFNYLQQQLLDSRKQMQDYLQGNQQQQQAQQQHVQLAQQVSAQEATYTQSVPDYPVAADYFYQRKVAEYTAFTGDPVAAQAQVAKDYQGIAALAQRLNKNPAELMYNAAKAMGYVPGAPKPGGQPQQRREAPTSLSNLGGAPKAPDEAGKVGVADISTMSDAEFDKFWNEDIKGGNRNQRPKI